MLTKIKLISSYCMKGFVSLYIQSSTEKLFRFITSLQCGYAREMLQGGMETRLILRQLDILPKTTVILSVSKGIFFVCMFIYTLSATTQFNLCVYIYIYMCDPKKTEPITIFITSTKIKQNDSNLVHSNFWTCW